MKVLYIDTPLEPPGGGQWSLFYILRNIDKKKFEISVFIPYYCQFYEMLKENNIDTNIVSPIELFYKVKKLKPDIIHCNSATTRYTFFSALISKILKIPFLWHNRVVETAGWKEKIIAKLSTKIIVISDNVGKKFINFSEKVVKIYNAVDTQIFQPNLNVKYLRNQLGLDDDTKVVGIFSRLDWWKGHKFVLDVFKELLKKLPKTKLLIVGDGPQKEDIVTYVYKQRILSNVIFLGYRKDIPQLMNVCDIILNPSVEPEPFGRTVIEAMACGKIVIASDLGGHKEIIDNNIDGFLLPFDKTAWVKKIYSILSNYDEYKKICEAARVKVLEKFSLDVQIKEIEKIYLAYSRLYEKK